MRELIRGRLLCRELIRGRLGSLLEGDCAWTDKKGEGLIRGSLLEGDYCAWTTVHGLIRRV